MRLSLLPPGLLWSPCHPHGYIKNQSEYDISGRRNRPAAGTAFGGGAGGRNTSDESPRGSKKAVNPYTWLVCAKLENG